MDIPLQITSDFTYVRFHGTNYSGSYSQEDLDAWSRRLADWSKTLSAIYVYFNNDIGGWAVKNASDLERLTNQYLSNLEHKS